jgi:hypothetical protein
MKMVFSSEEEENKGNKCLAVRVAIFLLERITVIHIPNFHRGQACESIRYLLFLAFSGEIAF